MSNMIKPAEYANKLGISRQAVYAKIKKGILSSRSVDGKLYIVLDEKANNNANVDSASKSIQKNVDHTKLLEAKDETITVLKETVRDLKETNQMITSTLRGEVDLLKEAFGEMKMLYSLQLEHKESKATIIEESSLEDSQLGVWLEIDNFYEEHGIKKKKKKAEIYKRFKKLFKKSDARVDRHNGEIVYLSGANFDDVLKKAE